MICVNIQAKRVNVDFYYGFHMVTNESWNNFIINTKVMGKYV